MKQEPISCRADNALAARCQSFAARWVCVLKRPIFYLAAYIDNNIYSLSLDRIGLAGQLTMDDPTFDVRTPTQTLLRESYKWTTT